MRSDPISLWPVENDVHSDKGRLGGWSVPNERTSISTKIYEREKPGRLTVTWRGVRMEMVSRKGRLGDAHASWPNTNKLRDFRRHSAPRPLQFPAVVLRQTAVPFLLWLRIIFIGCLQSLTPWGIRFLSYYRLAHLLSDRCSHSQNCGPHQKHCCRASQGVALCKRVQYHLYVTPGLNTLRFDARREQCCSSNCFPPSPTQNPVSVGPVV
jgi:hypothetical protein